MNRLMLAGIIVSSLLALTYAPLSVRVADPDIRGKITQIHRTTDKKENGIIGTVMVEAEKKDGKVDKASLIITDETRILKEEGEKRERGTFEDLKVEQTVEARFVEGPTIMIYPLRVKASEIVILKSQ
jgi:hypothetical protein